MQWLPFCLFHSENANPGMVDVVFQASASYVTVVVQPLVPVPKNENNQSWKVF